MTDAVRDDCRSRSLASRRTSGFCRRTRFRNASGMLSISAAATRNTQTSRRPRGASSSISRPQRRRCRRRRPHLRLSHRKARLSRRRRRCRCGWSSTDGARIATAPRSTCSASRSARSTTSRAVRAQRSGCRRVEAEIYRYGRRVSARCSHSGARGRRPRRSLDAWYPKLSPTPSRTASHGQPAEREVYVALDLSAAETPAPPSPPMAGSSCPTGSWNAAAMCNRRRRDRREGEQDSFDETARRSSFRSTPSAVACVALSPQRRP